MNRLHFLLILYRNIFFAFSDEKLREIVKRLIRDRYKDIEDEFKRLDRSSYGELTPELLFHLFQRFVSSFFIYRISCLKFICST